MFDPRAPLGQLTLLHHQRPRLAAPPPLLRLALERRAQRRSGLSEVRSKSRVGVRPRAEGHSRDSDQGWRVVRARDRGEPQPHLLQLVADLPHSRQLSSLGSLHPADRLDPVRVQRSKVGRRGKAAGDPLRSLLRRHCPWREVEGEQPADATACLGGRCRALVCEGVRCAHKRSDFPHEKTLGVLVCGRAN